MRKPKNRVVKLDVPQLARIAQRIIMRMMKTGDNNPLDRKRLVLCMERLRDGWEDVCTR